MLVAGSALSAVRSPQERAALSRSGGPPPLHAPGPAAFLEVVLGFWLVRAYEIGLLDFTQSER